MGRPPHGGGPVFRFSPNEVVEMEACLLEHNNALPDRGLISSLAEKFSASAERVGKIIIQPKQVWNWFQNRRYAQRAKTVKASGKLNALSQDDLTLPKSVLPSIPTAPVRNSSNLNLVEFEAKSLRDGAWYDVAQLISHRMLDNDDPEVRVRFTGFGIEDDEWINVRKRLRRRSLPCESSDCVVVLPGDLVLCFQEGKEQALYFDARIVDAQRRRHDVRGCRCRFLVRYEHDQSEEVVALRKICRRPETDYRLRMLRSSSGQNTVEPTAVAKNMMYPGNTSIDPSTAPQKIYKQRLMDVNTEKVLVPPRNEDPVPMEITDSTAAADNKSGLHTPT